MTHFVFREGPSIGYDSSEEVRDFQKAFDKYVGGAMSGLLNSQVSNFEIRGWGEAPNHQVVKLKVTLSRPLTWSEREYLRVNFTETFRKGEQNFIDTYIFKLSVDVEIGPDPTRDVAWELHEFLAAHFFNVHIRAVQTITPKVKL